MTWYTSGTYGTVSHVVGLLEMLKLRLVDAGWSLKRMTWLVTYDSGTGTLPALLSTVTWDTTKTAVYEAQVSGNNAAGVMRLSVGANVVEAADVLSSGGWSATVSSIDFGECVFQAPGPATGRECYLGFRINPTYAWNLTIFGLLGYTAGVTMENQPGYSVSMLEDTPYTTPASPVTTTWWLSVNNNRMVLVTKMGSICFLLAGGLFVPYGTDAQYGYPQFVWGSSSGSNYSYTYGSHSFAYTYQACRLPGGSIQNFLSYYGTCTSYCLKTLGTDLLVLEPIEVIRSSVERLGYIEGLACGQHSTPESTVDIGSDTWISFTNGTRQASAADFLWVKQA